MSFALVWPALHCALVALLATIGNAEGSWEEKLDALKRAIREKESTAPGS